MMIHHFGKLHIKYIIVNCVWLCCLGLELWVAACSWAIPVVMGFCPLSAFPWQGSLSAATEI